jgi:hypothetical protein
MRVISVLILSPILSNIRPHARSSPRHPRHCCNSCRVHVRNPSASCERRPSHPRFFLALALTHSYTLTLLLTCMQLHRLSQKSIPPSAHVAFPSLVPLHHHRPQVYHLLRVTFTLLPILCCNNCTVLPPQYVRELVRYK